MASGLQMPQDSLFGIGVQSGSGATQYALLSDGYGNPETSSMYYFPLTDCNMGITKQADQLPPEIGGLALTFGTFVTGVWGGGTASMLARLENRLGWLLLATMGSASVISNTKLESLPAYGGGGGGSDNGFYSHVFTFSSDDEFFAPWVTIYRKLPHTTAEEEVGEIMQDGRIGTFTLNAAAGAPVGIDLGLVARRYQDSNEFDANPGWTGTFDDLSTFAVPSCTGHFRIGGNTSDYDFKVTAFSVNINNNVLPPNQSLYIGSIDPWDFPLLTRTVTVTATILVENYDLYMSAFTGSDVDVWDDPTSTDSTAACTIYEAQLDAMVASQAAMGVAGDTTEPYKLRIASNEDTANVAWTVRPIRTTPGRPVVLQAIGNVQALSSGTAFYMGLQNTQTTYEVS